MTTAFLATKIVNNSGDKRFITVKKYSDGLSRQIDNAIATNSLWFNDGGVIKFNCMNNVCYMAPNLSYPPPLTTGFCAFNDPSTPGTVRPIPFECHNQIWRSLCPIDLVNDTGSGNSGWTAGYLNSNPAVTTSWLLADAKSRAVKDQYANICYGTDKIPRSSTPTTDPLLKAMGYTYMPLFYTPPGYSGSYTNPQTDLQLISSVKNQINMTTIPNEITKQTDVPTTDTYLIEPVSTTQTYFFSRPNGNYILYKKNGLYSLLHNPIPRPEYANFFNSTAENQQLAFDTVINTCVENNGSDSLCKCLNKEQTSPTKPNTEFCMDNLLGSHSATQTIKTSRQAYEQIASICGCSDTDCQSKPFNKLYRDKNGSHKCPEGNIVVTACLSNLSANTLNAQGINVTQNCGSQQNTTAPPPAWTAPPVSTPPVSTPPVSTPQVSTPPVSTPPSSSSPTLPPSATSMSKTMIISITIVILLLLSIGYFYLSKK